MGFLHKVAWLGVMFLVGAGQVNAATTQKNDSNAAIALLEKALAYYHDNGDKAFAAFSRQGEFVDKDRYVFVVDTKGVMLASGGPSSALIGRDVSETLGPDLQKAFDYNRQRGQEDRVAGRPYEEPPILRYDLAMQEIYGKP